MNVLSLAPILLATYHGRLAPKGSVAWPLSMAIAALIVVGSLIAGYLKLRTELKHRQAELRQEEQPFEPSQLP